MRVYLDLDNTLLATRVFYHEFYRELLLAEGNTEREIDMSYTFFANGATLLGEAFSPRRQMEILGWREVTKERVLASIENILREKRGFIFPEVVTVLMELRRRGATLILLTFGNEEFQKQKIIASGIAHHFDEIKVTGGDKTEIVLGDREGEAIVFVDDKVEFMERLSERKDIQTFHMCRREIEEPLCEKGQCLAEHEIESLEELLRFIP